MKGYEIAQLDKGLWAIDDGIGCSMYLVEGRDKALLIDTGVQEGQLLPLLRQLTDKPIALALTHAHIDHMYHADEFDTVYLHRKDIRAWHGPIGLCMWLGPAMFHVKHKKYHIKEYIPIDESSAIDLGGVVIRVLDAPGHTPGSVIFVDDTHRALFTGDAFGSGSGAWLWLPGCYCVKAYRDALGELLKKLKPYENYQFLGGHRKQGAASEENPSAHPLTIQVVRDMEQLCGKMLSGEVKPEGSTKIGPFMVNTYRFGYATMMQRASKIH